jgi:hypothetical protein
MESNKVYLVKISTCNDEYLGTFHSPFPGRRLSDVISRIDGYLSLKDVTCAKSGEKFPFILVNKNSIETISVLKEVEAAD